MKRKFLKFENTDFLAYFPSNGSCVTHEVGVACRAPCNCVVRIPTLYGWKEIVTFSFIITQLLKLEWGENSCEVNSTPLTKL